MRRDNKSFAFPVGTFILFIGVLLLSLKGAPSEKRLVIGVEVTQQEVADSLLAVLARGGAKIDAFQGPMGRTFQLVECQGQRKVRMVLETLPPGTENATASAVLMAHALPQEWRPDVVVALALCEAVNAQVGDILLNTAWAIGHHGRYEGEFYRPEDLWTWDPTLQRARFSRHFWPNQRLLGMAVDSYLRFKEDLMPHQLYADAGAHSSGPVLHVDRVGISADLRPATTAALRAWQEAFTVQDQGGLFLVPGSLDNGLAAAAKVFEESGIPFAGTAVNATTEQASAVVPIATRFLWAWIVEVGDNWAPTD